MVAQYIDTYSSAPTHQPTRTLCTRRARPPHIHTHIHTHTKIHIPTHIVPTQASAVKRWIGSVRAACTS